MSDSAFPAAPDDNPVPDPVAVDDTGWQPLPARARLLFLIGPVPAFALPAAVIGFVHARMWLVDMGWLPAAWPAGLAGLVAGAAVGAWLGRKQYRYTAWRHDRHGLALRKGRFWQKETRVPASRVQHLDVKRGPLQRRRRLATLVVHTAGTSQSSVTVPNMDDGDAERLREALSRQIEHGDGD
jgi:membrane protein YdbS with pleckstrin-like domain